MTVGELIIKLKELAKESKDGKCLGIIHMDADELLLDYINNDEVVKAFNDIDKWYD